MNKENTILLSNNLFINSLGYGTWRTSDADAEAAVCEAVKCGYRLIDTAAIYGNEKGIGRGIKSCGVSRNELFVTSKLWNSERGYDKTMKAFEQTLSDLDTDYLDLYLIHWPANRLQSEDPDAVNLSTWRAFTKLYKEGRIKAIGVSNFLPHHLAPLMETEIQPMINQIEYHPGYIQTDTVNYCKENGIALEAWSPLGRGNIFTEPTLLTLAEKYNKTVAQICIRFAIDSGVIPLPKSVTPERIKENFNVFDFSLSKEDIKKIEQMDLCGYSGLNPDTFNR